MSDLQERHRVKFVITHRFFYRRGTPRLSSRSPEKDSRRKTADFRGTGMDNTRKIEFEGISNVRDLGTLRTKTGKEIRSRCLIRSANLSGAVPEDIRKLKEDCRLSMVLDLRTPMARKRKPDVEIDGVTMMPVVIFTDAMIGVTHDNDRDYERRKTMMPDMRDLYRMMVSAPVCRERFGFVLRTIMEHDFDQGSVLWHCSEGKDRCGLISAFLLTALEVDWDTIVEDYLMTNEVNSARAEDYYRKVLENGASREVAESVKKAFLASEEYLNAAFGYIRREYPGDGEYLVRGLGLTEELIEDFRNRMLI